MAWGVLGSSVWLHEGLVPLVVLFLVGHGYTALLLISLSFTKSRWLFGTGFSERKYYLLMGWAPLTFAVLALTVDMRFAAFAVVAALAGMIGETLLGLSWSWFFQPPIWTYSYRALLRGRTATINALPWMIGALLFLCAGRLVGVAPASPPSISRSPWVVSLVAMAAGVAGSWLLLAVAWRRDHRTKRFTVARFALFCSPIAVTATVLGWVCSIRYIALMVACAVVGSITEYAYGRSMSLFFERPLWTYHHLQVDGGHSSLVTLPLWALGGLYFQLIAAELGLA